MTINVRLKVVTPSGPVIDETVSAVSACSEVGEFCVLPEHRPLLAALKPGRLMFEQNGETKVYATDAGFFEGGLEHVNLMTQHCVAEADVDREGVTKELAELNEQLAALPGDSAKRGALQASIAWSEAQMLVSKEK